MTMSAPSSRQRCSRSGAPAVAATRAPSALATWMAWLPMPLLPPWIRNVSPAASRPAATMFDQTVQATSGSPPAVTRSTPAGMGSSWAAGTATCSAYPPPASKRAHLVARPTSR